MSAPLAHAANDDRRLSADELYWGSTAVLDEIFPGGDRGGVRPLDLLPYPTLDELAPLARHPMMSPAREGARTRFARAVHDRRERIDAACCAAGVALLVMIAGRVLAAWLAGRLG